MTGSAGQRRVPETFLADLEVPYPPVREQRRLAEVLDRADSRRTRRRAALALLDEVMQSMFFDLFGDPAFLSANWPTNSAELVGKTAIYRGDQSLAYAGYLVRLRVNAENDPEYLAAFLNTKYAKKVLRGMCKSIIGMANINATEVQTIRIAQPPLNLQREFARRVAAAVRIKATLRSSLTLLDELFASLQQRAFCGEL